MKPFLGHENDFLGYQIIDHDQDYQPPV